MKLNRGDDEKSECVYMVFFFMRKNRIVTYNVEYVLYLIQVDHRIINVVNYQKPLHFATSRLLLFDVIRILNF
jgi:hypothetical protein